MISIKTSAGNINFEAIFLLILLLPPFMMHFLKTDTNFIIHDSFCKVIFQNTLFFFLSFFRDYGMISNNIASRVLLCIYRFKMKNKTRSNILLKTAVFIYLSILTLLVAFQNTDSIWGNGETWVDASVYKYVAWMMDLGYMPYKDTFDHKGPLVYIFFWIGRKFGSWRGVWVPYVVLIFVSLLLLYLVIRKFCSPALSCVLMPVIFAVLFDYEIHAMSPEGLAIPFMAGGLYIFLDYFLFNSSISKLRLFLCGLCFGCILMIKAQMTSVWIVFSIAVLIKNIREKSIPNIGKFLIFFLLGCGAAVVPILLWLIRGDAFRDFIADYIVFNSKYAALYTGNTPSEIFAERVRAVTYFLNKPIILLSLFYCLAMIRYKKENRAFHISYLIYLLCSIGIAALSGRKYGHYGTSLIVAVTYPLAVSLGSGFNAKAEMKRLLTLLGLTYLICIYALPVVLSKVDNTMNSYINYAENKNSISSNLESIVNCVKENSGPDDLITVHGLYDIVYGLSKRRSASRYTYQHAFPLVDPPKTDEYYLDLAQNLPVLIVEKIPNEETRAPQVLDHSRMLEFIEKHGYELIETSPDKTYSIYKLTA